MAANAIETWIRSQIESALAHATEGSTFAIADFDDNPLEKRTVHWGLGEPGLPGTLGRGGAADLDILLEVTWDFDDREGFLEHVWAHQLEGAVTWALSYYAGGHIVSNWTQKRTAGERGVLWSMEAVLRFPDVKLSRTDPVAVPPVVRVQNQQVDVLLSQADSFVYSVDVAPNFRVSPDGASVSYELVSVTPSDALDSATLEGSVLRLDGSSEFDGAVDVLVRATAENDGMTASASATWRATREVERPTLSLSSSGSSLALAEGGTTSGSVDLAALATATPADAVLTYAITSAHDSTTNPTASVSAAGLLEVAASGSTDLATSVVVRVTATANGFTATANYTLEIAYTAIPPLPAEAVTIETAGFTQDLNEDNRYSFSVDLDSLSSVQPGVERTYAIRAPHSGTSNPTVSIGAPGNTMLVHGTGASSFEEDLVIEMTATNAAGSSAVFTFTWELTFTPPADPMLVVTNPTGTFRLIAPNYRANVDLTEHYTITPSGDADITIDYSLVGYTAGTSNPTLSISSAGVLTATATSATNFEGTVQVDIRARRLHAADQTERLTLEFGRFRARPTLTTDSNVANRLELTDSSPSGTFDISSWLTPSEHASVVYTLVSVIPTGMTASLNGTTISATCLTHGTYNLAFSAIITDTGAYPTSDTRFFSFTVVCSPDPTDVSVSATSQDVVINGATAATFDVSSLVSVTPTSATPTYSITTAIADGFNVTASLSGSTITARGTGQTAYTGSGRPFVVVTISATANGETDSATVRLNFTYNPPTAPVLADAGTRPIPLFSLVQSNPVGWTRTADLDDYYSVTPSDATIAYSITSAHTATTALRATIDNTTGIITFMGTGSTDLTETVNVRITATKDGLSDTHDLAFPVNYTAPAVPTLTIPTTTRAVNLTQATRQMQFELRGLITGVTPTDASLTYRITSGTPPVHMTQDLTGTTLTISASGNAVLAHTITVEVTATGLNNLTATATFTFNVDYQPGAMPPPLSLVAPAAGFVVGNHSYVTDIRINNGNPQRSYRLSDYVTTDSDAQLNYSVVGSDDPSPGLVGTISNGVLALARRNDINTAGEIRVQVTASRAGATSEPVFVNFRGDVIYTRPLAGVRPNRTIQLVTISRANPQSQSVDIIGSTGLVVAGGGTFGVDNFTVASPVEGTLTQGVVSGGTFAQDLVVSLRDSTSDDLGQDRLRVLMTTHDGGQTYQQEGFVLVNVVA